MAPQVFIAEVIGADDEDVERRRRLSDFSAEHMDAE
jgi:hypothetical protein